MPIIANWTSDVRALLLLLIICRFSFDMNFQEKKRETQKEIKRKRRTFSIDYDFYVSTIQCVSMCVLTLFHYYSGSFFSLMRLVSVTYGVTG